MGAEHGTYGGYMHKGFWQGNMKERDHLEDLHRDGRIKFLKISKK